MNSILFGSNKKKRNYIWLLFVWSENGRLLETKLRHKYIQFKARQKIISYQQNTIANRAWQQINPLDATISLI